MRPDQREQAYAGVWALVATPQAGATGWMLDRYLTDGGWLWLALTCGSLPILAMCVVAMAKGWKP